ncbi:hypothetical protein DFJ77DRAFT_469696 [Powellomyces hirtus]|nr:hypothetical protein DFJ77DRAFT_469696 [Powellomyces hirtus]
MVSPTLTNVSARCQSPSTSCISASPTDSHHSKHPFLTPPMPTPFQPRSPMVIDELFTPPVIHDIMRTFFDDCSTRWVQMPIHEATFMREFDSQPSYLVYALCAMSASSCGNTALRSYVALRGVPNYRAGEQYFWRALSMVNYMVQNPSLESCIALASLKYAASLANELQWSEPLRRATIDTAIKLNLHIDPDIEEVHGRLPWLMKEQMRRTWWAAFVMDTVDTNVSDRFATLSIPLNILPKLHSTGGSSWAVKPIAPSALYNSVTAHDGEPTLSAFVPDLHLDVAKGVYHFTGLFLRIMRLRGPIFQVLDATLKGLRGRDGNLEGAFPSPDPAAAAQWELSADVQHTIQDIHLELSQSLDLLPDWARSIDQYDTFSNNSADTYPPPWQLYTQHLIADCMYIALHLPTIFIYTRLKQPPSHPAISKAFSICLTHAHRVSARLRRLRTINPSCFCMSQYASFFVLYSAIVIIMAARLGVTGNVVPLADPYQPLYRRTTPLQDLHENLDIYLWFTHQMGHKHYFAAYAHAFIRSMRDECAEQSA